MPSVQPDGRLLWRLRRRSSNVSCILYATSLPVEVRVLQDRDIVLSEIFPEEVLARQWAAIYGERLKQQGWRDAPSEVA